MIEIQLHVSKEKVLNEHINPVVNHMFVKPIGGFWTSTFNGKSSSWIDWCEAEEFNKSNGFDGFLVTPKKDTNIYTIDELKDLVVLFEKYEMVNELSSYFKLLDYEKLSLDFDGIHLTDKGQWETRMSRPYNLYGWDCECTLWFRWCFEKVEKFVYSK